ncbi:TetR/AcrR family transcriptional regulator [Actinophytocola oryzae]|uniref:TetR family transcriptional regulator n=1 Tax=Actinophytocola oryzae TaxID=502181 RepID=A0A4R7W6S6_9PSEU|nr:TetR/AcrR family transcriptional regulator [Actinophytocola oryzae]TDV57868.1 TetR family transcriptional regulator [Actinophytocola oryzae]
MTAAAGTRDAEIRDAALELFARDGYRATTMGDIGAAVGVRGPSLYKHVTSKQDLLARIMLDTMAALREAHGVAVRASADPAVRLRRAVEAHVRYHARHRLEAFVGNREIRSLEEPHRTAVLASRDDYEHRFRALVADGVHAGRFDVTSVRLASYAVLDLGMGVAAWYREDGELSEDEIVWYYGDLAMRIVGAPG